MLGVQNLPVFLASCLVLAMTPGQDTLYIVGRTLAQGRRAGLLSALGINVGLVFHTLAAALGLSAILATSASAFAVIKLAGAAYLVYLGVSMWRQPSAPAAERPLAPAASDRRIFAAGLLTNILNPKVALFFLAFLPQFVDPAAPSKVAAFLVLGGLFILVGLAWTTALVFGSAAISRHLRGSSKAGALARRSAGAAFVGLGVKLAVSK
jgi:RhtB (resistance to homoserine/threonine) family protein